MNIFADIVSTFRAHRARFVLTLSGVAIGVGSLVVLASLLESGQGALVAAADTASEADLIEVQPAPGPVRRDVRPLELADGDALATDVLLDGAPVVAEQELPAVARVGTRHARVQVIGTTPAARELYDLPLAAGRFLDASDIADGQRVAVIGDGVRTELVGTVTPGSLGHLVVLVGNERFAVVGVLAHKPTLSTEGLGWDQRILIPYSAFRASYRASARVDRLFVRLARTHGLGGRASEVRRWVAGALLRRRHGQRNFRIAGENDDGHGEWVGLIVRSLLVSGSLLALIVGGINIMNIMLIGVTERAKEIGLRRALGATRRSILLHFLLESGLTSLIGGILGVGGGLAMTVLIVKLLEHWLPGFGVHIAGWSLAVGLATSAGVGIVFGTLPAWRAARLDPSIALRTE